MEDNNLTDIKELLLLLNKNIETLTERVDNMEKTIQSLNDECVMINNNPDLVDTIYETVKKPISYIKNKINEVSLQQYKSVPNNGESDGMLSCGDEDDDFVKCDEKV